VRAGDAAAAGALIPDEALDRLAFSGTPEHVVGQVEALFAAGAARVELGTPHGLTDRGGVELLASRVAPAFGV
jgi:5,10-methylenetetrahydromethanopterin reductase